MRMRDSGMETRLTRWASPLEGANQVTKHRTSIEQAEAYHHKKQAKNMVKLSVPISVALLLLLVVSTEASCCVQRSEHSLGPDQADVADVSFCPGGEYLFARDPPRSCTGSCTPHTALMASGTMSVGNVGYSLHNEGSSVEYLCCKFALPLIAPLPPSDENILPGPGPPDCPKKCFKTLEELNEVLLKSKMMGNYGSAGVESIYGPIGDWCFDDSITNFNYLFANHEEFNEDISRWDVSHITSMNGMFFNALKFNQPIGVWNVTKVRFMNAMFMKATKFNSPIEDWDTSSVYDMIGMFQQAYAFNQPLQKWNVSTVYDMRNMFHVAIRFNQPIEEWDMSNVGYLRNTFNRARAFNQPLEKWNTRLVRSLRDTFLEALAFNQPLAKWNVSKVTNMRDVFRNATLFRQDLCEWGERMRGGVPIRFTNSTFENTNCPNMNDPDTGLGVDPITPLCFDCF